MHIEGVKNAYQSIYQTSIERITYMYRKCIKHITKLNRTYIERISKVYRKWIESESNNYLQWPYIWRTADHWWEVRWLDVVSSPWYQCPVRWSWERWLGVRLSPGWPTGAVRGSGLRAYPGRRSRRCWWRDGGKQIIYGILNVIINIQ